MHGAATLDFEVSFGRGSVRFFDFPESEIPLRFTRQTNILFLHLARDWCSFRTLVLAIHILENIYTWRQEADKGVRGGNVEKQQKLSNMSGCIQNTKTLL